MKRAFILHDNQANFKKKVIIMMLGKQIKAYREQAGLSQEQLAKQIVCNPAISFKMGSWRSCS